jgi:hypothetical protein
LQAADVGRARNRGSESIMRHRPLSRQRSAIDFRLASAWLVFSVKPSVNEGRSFDQQRSWDLVDPSQFSSCQQGEGELLNLFAFCPACCLMNIHPDGFSQGIDRPKLHLP